MSGREHVKTRSISEVAHVMPGRHLLGEQHNTNGCGVPYITGPSDFGLIQATASRWTETPDVMCSSGDILITVKGAGVGRVNFAPDQPTCIGRQVMAIRARENMGDSWFIFFALQEQAKFISGQAVGGTIPGLSIKDIATIKVSLPDLPTQRQIASRLKEQMSAVEQARHAASSALQSIRVLLDKTIAESFHSITPLSLGRDEVPAPEGWRWQSLLELARLATGHTPSRRCPEYWANGDIPWLALPDIRALDCHVVTETSEMTNAKGIANSSARLLPAGTVALSRTASVGFVTIFGREMATSQDFVNWVCGPDLNPPFLMWLLRAARPFIKGASTGAVHQTVYMDVVERFRVCIPSLEAQTTIAARLDESFRLIQHLQAAHEAQLEALDKLPGAYLREAFGSLAAQ